MRRKADAVNRGIEVTGGGARSPRLNVGVWLDGKPPEHFVVGFQRRILKMVDSIRLQRNALIDQIAVGVRIPQGQPELVGRLPIHIDCGCRVDLILKGPPN